MAVYVLAWSEVSDTFSGNFCEMTACPTKDIDVFVTKDDYDLDEEEVRENALWSSWTLETGPAEVDASTVLLRDRNQTVGTTDNDPNVEVGDLVRIGTSDTSSTPWLTVMGIVSFTIAPSNQTRKFVRVNYAVNASNFVAGAAVGLPLYKQKPWSPMSDMRISLSQGIKKVHSAKLMGYNLVNRTVPGVATGHEVPADDYVVLKVDSLPGDVISNNRVANGSFAVLPTAEFSNSATDEHHKMSCLNYQPGGIVTHNYSPPISTLHQLIIRLLDRRGNKANVGRLHLWFRFTVEQA